MMAAMHGTTPTSAVESISDGHDDGDVGIGDALHEAAALVLEEEINGYLKFFARLGQDKDALRRVFELWTPQAALVVWKVDHEEPAWMARKSVMRLLGRLVLQPGSSAGSERCYSVLGSFHTSLRACLKPQALCALLCLRLAHGEKFDSRFS